MCSAADSHNLQRNSSNTLIPLYDVASMNQSHLETWNDNHISARPLSSSRARAYTVHSMLVAIFPPRILHSCIARVSVHTSVQLNKTWTPPPLPLKCTSRNPPPATPATTNAHGNWVARLAAISILTQKGQSHCIGVFDLRDFV